MKKSKTQKRVEQIFKHGQDLIKIFHLEKDYPEPSTLCKKLHRLEKQANQLALDYCNGVVDLEQWENKKEKLFNKVESILHFSRLNIPVFFNSDPRGYAFKIESEYIFENSINIYRDFGGYGIICPEF